VIAGKTSKRPTSTCLSLILSSLIFAWQFSLNLIPGPFSAPGIWPSSPFLSDTGVRREVLSLIKDGVVNLDDLQVRVYAPKTPGRRWRLVPFSEETGAVLANYARQRAKFIAGRSRRRAKPGTDQRVKHQRRLTTDCFFINEEGGRLQAVSVGAIIKHVRG
jgi:site-specific recombinase XerD